METNGTKTAKRTVEWWLDWYRCVKTDAQRGIIISLVWENEPAAKRIEFFKRLALDDSDEN